MNMLLIGKEPPCPLGYAYVKSPPYDGVVIGSMTLGELMGFSDEAVLDALAQGKPVVLYEQGLPSCKSNRGLAASVGAKKRELKNWGVVFTSGQEKRVITATMARQMLSAGERPAPGAVLTPLAKELLEGQG